MARTRGNSNKIQHRRGPAAEWTVTNPILLAGELGYETDTTRLKFGDGGTQWTSLPYVGAYGAADLDGLSDVTLTSPAAGSVLRYDGSSWTDYVLAKSDLGLGNVDNTSDANKPVSTAQAAADSAVQAYAIQRANHTGTQGAATITGLATVATSGSYNDLSNKPAAYSLPNATTTTLGGVVVGTGLGVSSGTISVTYGTSSGTACQGDDSRLSNSRSPTGSAGGVLSGTYPNPGFAASPAFTGTATFDASSGVPVTITNTGTGNSFVVNDASGDTTPFVIDASGNVGVGMVSPAHRLDVSGQIRATGAQDPLIVCDATNNQNNSIWLSKNGAARWYIWNNDTTNVFNIGNPTTNPCVTVTTAGNVGIGTTSPARTLHVSSGVFFAARISSTDTTATVLELSHAASTWELAVNGTTGPTGAAGTFYIFQQGAGARLAISTTGNVGIGTASPTISSGVGLHLSGSTIRLGTARTPASSTATGNTGEICWDASYLYICTATNTWRRIAHSTW